MSDCSIPLWLHWLEVTARLCLKKKKWIPVIGFTLPAAVSTPAVEFPQLAVTGDRPALSNGDFLQSEVTVSTWYEKVWIPSAKVRMVEGGHTMHPRALVWVQESCCSQLDRSLLVVLQSGETQEVDRSCWIFLCISLDVQLVLFAYARCGLCIRSLLSSVPVIGLRTYCGDLSGECIPGKGSGPLWPLNKISTVENGRMEVWWGAAHTLTRWGWVSRWIHTVWVWSCA